MKVTDVRMETYRWPNVAQMVRGRFLFAGEGLDVVRVDTDDGPSGIGLSWSVGEVAEMGRSIVEHIGRKVVGQDPLDNEKIWDVMWDTGVIGRRGLTTRMLSAIDVALWDIKGKVAGQPLYKLLGGFTDTVPAYISRGFRTEGDSLKAVASTMEKALEEKAQGVKMQVGGTTIKQDVQRVRVARETLGSGVKLMLDASCLFRFYEAIELARKVERYEIFWLEEPVRPDDYRGYQLVSQGTSIPIAGGEGEYTKHGFRDLIEGRCVAIVQPDALIMGGVTEWMKVAAMAQAHDLVVSPHGPHHVQAHLVASISNGLNVEEFYTSYTEPVVGGIFEDRLPAVDGNIHLSARPGLGIDLNEEAIAPYRET